MKIIRSKFLKILSALLTFMIGVVSFLFWYRSRKAQRENPADYRMMLEYGVREQPVYDLRQPEYGVKEKRPVTKYGVRPTRPKPIPNNLTKKGVLQLINTNSEIDNNTNEK